MLRGLAEVVAGRIVSGRVAGWLVVIAGSGLFFASPLAAAPPEVMQPGILAEGTPHATPYYIRESSLPGPTVLLIGGIHGNEPAGAQALEVVRWWPITSGKLVLVPHANPTALAAQQRLIPQLPPEQGDLNRLFPQPAGPAELAANAHPLAAALWQLTLQTKPDWLIDCHEGFDFGSKNPQSVGSSIISSQHAEAQAMAEAMLVTVNTLPQAPQVRFTLRGPPIAGSLARAASEHLGVKSMILETTTKGQRLPIRTRQHRALLATFLQRIGMLPADVGPSLLVSALCPESVIQVGLFDDSGVAGQGIPRITAQLSNQADLRLVNFDGEDARSGALQNFDVLIFSGGSGSRQSESLGDAGRLAVRTFVEHGGSYIGICAGGYLACSGFSWDLDLLNAKTKSSRWQRGQGTVAIEWTDLGRTQLARDEDRFSIVYANGPIWEPLDRADLPRYEILAWFREEVAENNTPVGLMVDSPAAVQAAYGQGNVWAFSAHPEQSQGGEHVVPRMIRRARAALTVTPPTVAP